IADEDEERRYRTDPLNDDTDGDGVIDGWEITYGYDPLNGTDDALRALCEWYESNETADQSIEALCNSNDNDGDDREENREITQEDCERRNGTWVETSDRSGEPYCDFGENDRDDRDEDREITQEDCERRNGTWAEAPDRPREFYCDFGDRDSEEESRFRYTNITLHIFHGENLENSTVNYTIKIQLNHSAAPIHADNFLKHVLYGNFNNSIFHRIIDDFMIEGGDFQNSSGAGGYAADWYGICNGTRIANQSDCPNQENWNIPDEADNGLRHLPCTISMAKTAEPNTGGSQFFLMPGDITHHNWLDGIHTVFGEVTEGCEHITSLSEVETGEMDRPVVTVVILSATVDN
ncbi:MAG: peptidylprolyl isomerase, partial [Candidatus Thermoplasmatota archaeon]|nr:peptidylprolyl isomerase [Candidatus Thermoplasmatota archaeon]